MGDVYLTDLAGVVRAGGLTVIEVDYWQTAARTSGGYQPGRPTHVMCHHTASPPSADGWPDVNYICSGSDIAPISNLYLSRSGCVWVCAAGCTNTNGSGSDWWGGGVPTDSMNSYAIGIEAGNDGVGEVWPDDQIGAYLMLVEVLCAAYAIPAAHVRAHWEWTRDTGRKIDPAGPSPFGAVNASGSWNMDAFRAALAPVAPVAPIEGDTMTYYRDDRTDGWQIWAVALDGYGSAWTCPIEDLPDGGKWHVVGPIVGDPPIRPFGALVALMDAQNRPAP